MLLKQCKIFLRFLLSTLYILYTAYQRPLNQLPEAGRAHRGPDSAPLPRRAPPGPGPGPLPPPHPPAALAEAPSWPSALVSPHGQAARSSAPLQAASKISLDTGYSFLLCWLPCPWINKRPDPRHSLTQRASPAEQVALAADGRVLDLGHPKFSPSQDSFRNMHTPDIIQIGGLAYKLNSWYLLITFFKTLIALFPGDQFFFLWGKPSITFYASFLKLSYCKHKVLLFF